MLAHQGGTRDRKPKSDGHTYRENIYANIVGGKSLGAVIVANNYQENEKAQLKDPLF